MVPYGGCSPPTLAGALVILPSLYLVRNMQDALLGRLARLPPLALRGLALQAQRRAKELKREAAQADGAQDDGDDDSDDEGGEHGGLVAGGGGGGSAIMGGGGGAGGSGLDHLAFLIDEDTGGIAWAALLEHAARARDEEEEGEGAGRGGYCGQSSTKGGGSWRLPLPLLVFALPCVALVPFYAAVYATTTGAVEGVLEAQARGGEADNGEGEDNETGGM